VCGHHDGGPWFPYLLLTAVSRLSLGALVPFSLGTLLAFPLGALAQGTPVPLYGSNCPTHSQRQGGSCPHRAGVEISDLVRIVPDDYYRFVL
jgi:hypothetical protein